MVGANILTLDTAATSYTVEPPNTAVFAATDN